MSFFFSAPSTTNTTHQKFISLNVHPVDGCLKYKFPDGWVIFGKICMLEVWVELFLRYEEERVQPETLAVDRQYQKALNFLEQLRCSNIANGLRVVRSYLFILCFSCKERLKCWRACHFSESNIWFRSALGSVSSDRWWNTVWSSTGTYRSRHRPY